MELKFGKSMENAKLSCFSVLLEKFLNSHNLDSDFLKWRFKDAFLVGTTKGTRRQIFFRAIAKRQRKVVMFQERKTLNPKVYEFVFTTRTVNELESKQNICKTFIRLELLFDCFVRGSCSDQKQEIYRRVLDVLWPFPFDKKKIKDCLDLSMLDSVLKNYLKLPVAKEELLSHIELKESFPTGITRTESGIFSYGYSFDNFSPYTFFRPVFKCTDLDKNIPTREKKMIKTDRSIRVQLNPRL